MKELSISSTNHHELKSSSKRWVLIFLSIIFAQIFLLTFISYKQKAKLAQLLSEIDTLESFVGTQQPILETKSKLKQDYESLVNKKAYLIGNTQLPKLVLKKISKNIPTDCCVSNVIFKNNIISVKGIAKTWTGLHNFFDTLSKIEKLGTIRLKSSTKESHYLNFEFEFSKTKK